MAGSNSKQKETPWRHETPEWNPKDQRPIHVAQLNVPWRYEDMIWDNALREKLMAEIKSYRSSKVKHFKILLTGPVGTGKSSFVNSAASIFHGHVVDQAPCGTEGTSVTRKYMEHAVTFDNGEPPLPFLLCDTAGHTNSYGITEREFEYFLSGNVPDGYQFNRDTRISPKNTPGFRHNPKLDERAHCVCFVFDVNNIKGLEEPLKAQFRAFVKVLREEGVPYVVMLTHIDRFCDDVRNNLSNAYTSASLQSIVDYVHEILGVPRKHITLMQNYEADTETSIKKDIIALLSLRQMSRACMGYLRNVPTPRQDGE